MGKLPDTGSRIWRVGSMPPASPPMTAAESLSKLDATLGRTKERDWNEARLQKSSILTEASGKTKSLCFVSLRD